MNPVAMVVREVRYEQKSFWRNPQSAFFTFLMPVLFLVIFGTLNDDNRVDELGGLLFNQYYVPSILTFGVMTNCYSNVAIALAIRRQTGVLKRYRGTPAPTWVLLAGLGGSALLVSLALVGITGGAGALLYDVRLPSRWPVALLGLLVGVPAFLALGAAVQALVRDAEAAPAVVQGILLPLVFVSGTFFPIDPHSALARVADVFPVRHFIQAVFSGFNPHDTGVPWLHLGVLAGWGLAGALVAVRAFTWEPKR